MAHTPWAPCPCPPAQPFSADTLPDHWSRLHRGDAEPLPADKALLDAWVLFHNGAFEAATRAGLALGADGMAVANKATCIHARYVEPSEPRRLAMWLEAAERARLHQAERPALASAWYWQGYALGRYSQGISVAKALAKGLGAQVRQALQTAIDREPRHADAHLALASFHAEVIDQVGELIGGMTHGARKQTGLDLYQRAMALNPDSAITLAEVAQGLVMLEGSKAAEQAAQLLRQAAAFQPLDAMERLYVESARMSLDL
jgi:tetratricopeptide (TPR) repeat protein